MKIRITAGSVMTQGGHFITDDVLSSPQYPESLLRHLVEINSAVYVEQKVVAPVETKVEVVAEKKSLPASPPDQVSQPKTRARRMKKQPQ